MEEKTAAANQACMPEIPLVMSVPEMAKILKIGKNAAYELIKSGEIGCRRIGKNIRIPRSALEAYLNKVA